MGPGALQVWAAGQDAGYAGQMVRARLDVPRFVQLNTAKGRWALLDDLDTAPLQSQHPGVEAATVAQTSSMANVSARPAMHKDAVVRIVREVAAGIISEANLEGVTHPDWKASHSACSHESHAFAAVSSRSRRCCTSMYLELGLRCRHGLSPTCVCENARCPVQAMTAPSRRVPLTLCRQWS